MEAIHQIGHIHHIGPPLVTNVMWPKCMVKFDACNKSLPCNYYGLCTLAVSGTGQALGLGQMGCMVLCWTFTSRCTWTGTGKNRLCAHFQVLKPFQVVCFNYISIAVRCPVLVPDTASVKGFCIISVRVPVPSTSHHYTAWYFLSKGNDGMGDRGHVLKTQVLRRLAKGKWPLPLKRR